MTENTQVLVGGDLFVKLDDRYFDPEEYAGCTLTLKQAAYKLATYLFDQGGRHRMKKIFPRTVYVKALENYADEDHDT